MNSDEYTEFEERAYINPTLSSGEQEQFINNLRDLQTQSNAQIAQQTYNLGTDIPSNLGGLGGGEGYFMSRYQTPQVDEMVATLKSAAQAQALQDVMSNYKDQLQNRYKQAYRRAQRRARNRARYSRGGGGGTTPTTVAPAEENVVQQTIEDTAGLNVGRDELARRDLTGKTMYDVVNEMIQETNERKERRNPTSRVNQIFGDISTQFQVGR